MTTMNLAPELKKRFFTSSGVPLANGLLYTYAANSTTPQVTYTNQGGSTNQNPVQLDANGYADVWLDPSLSYKFVLKDSDGNTQWTVDNVVGLLGAGSVVTDSLADGAVTTAKLADLAVTNAKLSSSASVDADRAVGTDNIKAGAVTGAKLDSSVADNSTLELASSTIRIKDGGVTAAKMVSSINLPGNAVKENGKNVIVSSTNASTTSLAIVRGQYTTTTPTIDFGEGFTIAKNGTGDVTVTFSNAFSDEPICVATAGPGAISDRLVQLNGFPGATGSAVRIKVYNLSGTPQEAAVNFIAIGQR
ncbi:MAG TPA: hypothetical protein VL588_11270 [Bdellovibrionota bacterium]|jgi:hypothetical protein|nr:hypothetical protein [Bdellovibrionota bacterium]